MKNIVSTKKTSSVFLAVVLVLGTFAVTSPSFMFGNVQAQRGYGMDSYDKKPYGTSYEQDYVNDNDNKPQIFPANKVAELGDRWWQWAASINVEENPNPFTELGQAGCDVGLQDNGRLLFLVGTSKNFTTYPDNGFPVHKCEIQKDVSILFPIVNTVCDSLEVNTPFFGANETAQRICANNIANTAIELHANIDGFEVKNPEQYRVDSPAGGFNINAVENNPVGIPAGNGTAVQDGFWILLKPLNQENMLYLSEVHWTLHKFLD